MGGDHACLLSQNIVCWGNNTYGQLGNGETDINFYLNENINIVPPCSGSDCDDLTLIEQVSQGSSTVMTVDDATAIVSGSIHTCALRRDRTVWCWGDNTWGQLGNGQSGDEEFSAQPLKVKDIADATAIATGVSHNCALHADGTVSCWGYNRYGQLGNGTYGRENNSSTPVKVQGVTDAVAIATSWSHTCALHTDGTVSCWGYDYSNTIFSAEPVKIDNVNNVRKIVSGYSHTCALHTDGTVTCWGDNNYGQIDGFGSNPESNGTIISFGKPEFFADEYGRGVDIVAGNFHTCVLRKYGRIYCWGRNWEGQLGIGEPYLGSISAIFTDADFASYLESGLLNNHERLWSSTTLNSQRTAARETAGYHPPSQALEISNAIAVFADGNITCALHENKTISCWGHNYFQSLDGRIRASAVPVKANNVNDAVSVVAGLEHTCALHQDGTVTCWGSSRHGKLGDPAAVAFGESPVMPYRIEGATSISSGLKFTCVLHQSGKISCWGNNWAGQLGNGASGWGEFTPDHFAREPTYTSGINDATQVSAGGYHTCALHEDGTISCWGFNDYGQLGNGKERLEKTGYYYNFYVEVLPVKTVGIDDATAVSAGLEHTCALHSDGTVSCWGNHRFAQLDDNNPDARTQTAQIKIASTNLPVKVHGITDAIAITSGNDHNCVLHIDETVSCWHGNVEAQLGDITITFSGMPTKVLGIVDVKAIAAGHDYTCALHTDGTVSCWGSSNFGKLGTDEMKVKESGTIYADTPIENYVINEALGPAKVQNIKEAVAIATGSQHTCVAHKDGTVSCWGDNREGQLGDGFATNSAFPIELNPTFSSVTATEP